MNETTETKHGPDVTQIILIGLVLFFVYLMAAGPVFRLCARRQLPAAFLVIYKPVMNPSEPAFDLMRDYVALWI